MHRIYRDVRFSKDKTPYKRYMCASHSRTGRKGPFALYYVHVQPGGKSFLGVGCWSPSADVLKLIRAEILSNPKPLRKILAKEAFVELFGEPKPRMDGKRSSIFGGDDQLKNAPKIEGVDKTHKDIDLLKCVPFSPLEYVRERADAQPPRLARRCRSFAVETHFSDEVVASPGFLDKLKHAMSVASEFAQYLNEVRSLSSSLPRARSSRGRAEADAAALSRHRSSRRRLRARTTTTRRTTRTRKSGTAAKEGKPRRWRRKAATRSEGRERAGGVLGRGELAQ